MARYIRSGKAYKTTRTVAPETPQYDAVLCTLVAAERARVDVAAVLIDIGRRVAELRAAKGLTQAQFAEVLGVDVTHLQKIEGGRLNVTVRTMVTLAAALELRGLAELFAPPASREVRPGRPKRRKGSESV